MKYRWFPLQRLKGFWLFSQLSCLPGHCRTSEELKYTMTRLAMDGVDLFVVEQGCAANIKVIGENYLHSMYL